jgi:hypothetical protein
LFEKNEAQSELETTKKEAEESARKAEESARKAEVVNSSFWEFSLSFLMIFYLGIFPTDRPIGSGEGASS